MEKVKQPTGPIYQNGDKLDLFLLSLVTLFVTLLTFGNISFPSLTGVDSSKYGVTFFDLEDFSYFSEMPLQLIHAIGIGGAAILLIFLLMLRRRRKNFVITIERVIFFIIALVIIAAFTVNALFLIPRQDSLSLKMILLGQTAADRIDYVVNISRYSMNYRISFVISMGTFVLYAYFLLMYLRTFNYCAANFIKAMRKVAIFVCAFGFMGVFFNSHSQDAIINNFNALLNPSLSVVEVTHPIISNSLLSAFTFIGCVTCLMAFYSKPNLFKYIIAGGFAFCSYLTGSVYTLALTLLAFAFTSIALLFNMRKHKAISLVTFLLTAAIIAFIVLAVSVLKGMFPTVNQIFVDYLPRLKRKLNADIYIWKVVFSATAFYTLGFIGFTPAIASPVIFEVSNIYNVRFAPYGTSNNAYVQMAANFGYIGIGLMFLGYVLVIGRCFGMLRKKKKAGFYYLLMFLVIGFASMFNESGLFSFNPLSMLYMVTFIYPLSSEYHRGVKKQKRTKPLPEPQQMKVEHKFVKYDVKADEINGDSPKEAEGNVSYQDAVYQEDGKPVEPPQQQSGAPVPPREREYIESDAEESVGNKKKNRDKYRRLVKKNRHKKSFYDDDNEEDDLTPSKNDHGETFNEELEKNVSQREFEEIPAENVRIARKPPENFQQVQNAPQPQQQVNNLQIQNENNIPQRRSEPNVLNMQEHPSTMISDYSRREIPSQHDEEYDEDVVERQIQYSNQPIKAHYRNDNREVNLSMTSKVETNRGKIVSRRSDIDYEDSYEIIEGKSENIRDDHVVKQRPRIIQEYDNYETQYREKINRGKNDISSQKEVKVLFDFNRDKQKEYQESRISSSIDKILHNSAPPPKPKTSGNISGFDDLLSVNSKKSNIGIEEFKRQSAKAKEELEAYKKMKNYTSQGEFSVDAKPEIAAKVGGFDNIVGGKGGIHPDSPGMSHEDLEDLIEEKEYRKRIKVKVYRSDDEEGEAIERRMNDGLF